MNDLPAVELNEKGFRSLELRHPWIYQRSCRTLPRGARAGDLVRVYHEGRPCAIGFFDPDSLYAVKILDFSDGSVPMKKLLTEKLARSDAFRRSFGPGEAFRLFHGEADGIPGLFIDRFGPVAVLKFEHEGVFRMKDGIVEAFRSLFNRISLFEIDPDNGRRWLDAPIEPLIVSVDGIRFAVDPHGQKTGFYLDQTANRQRLAAWVRPGMNVLDAFAYSGAFGIYAMKAGARATAVESVARHSDLFAMNCELNGLSDYTTVTARVEKFLEETSERFDAVFLDPPALVARRDQKKKAFQFIGKLVRQTLKVLRPGGFFAVSVCSHNLTGSELPATIRGAVAGSGRVFRMEYEGRAAADHPVLLNFPEGDYLRCLAYREVI